KPTMTRIVLPRKKLSASARACSETGGTAIVGAAAAGLGLAAGLATAEVAGGGLGASGGLGGAAAGLGAAAGAQATSSRPSSASTSFISQPQPRSAHRFLLARGPHPKSGLAARIAPARCPRPGREPLSRSLPASRKGGRAAPRPGHD